MLRAVKNPIGLAQCKAYTGSLEVLRGERRFAAEVLDDAAREARKAHAYETEMLALSYRALAPGADVEGTIRKLAACEERLGMAQRVEVHYLLWKATGRREHLDEAHRVLLFLRQNSPAEHHEPMMRNVPQHREIMEAWDTA